MKGSVQVRPREGTEHSVLCDLFVVSIPMIILLVIRGSLGVVVDWPMAAGGEQVARCQEGSGKRTSTDGKSGFLMWQAEKGRQGKSNRVKSRHIVVFCG